MSKVLPISMGTRRNNPKFSNGSLSICASNCRTCGRKTDVTTVDGKLVEYKPGTREPHKCPEQKLWKNYPKPSLEPDIRVFRDSGSANRNLHIRYLKILPR